MILMVISQALKLEINGEMDNDRRYGNVFSSNMSIPFSRHVSDEDLGAIDLNPQVIRIGGERVNGQSPNLGIVIEFRDGKPILKSYTNDSNDDEDLNNQDFDSKENNENSNSE